MQKVYVAGTPITVSRQRTRVRGLSPSKLSEAESIDIYGNKTVSTAQLNAGTATITQVVNVPDSETDAITITIQGRTIASTSPTGLTVAFQYDGLGRRTHVIDPGTGTSTTHYDAAGRVDYVEDALGRRTSFGTMPLAESPARPATMVRSAASTTTSAGSSSRPGATSPTPSATPTTPTVDAPA